MTDDAEYQLEAWRDARRDEVGRTVRRAIKLCADYCESELHNRGATLFSDIKVGDVRSLRRMVEAVHRRRPADWSFADVEAVSLALAVLDHLVAAVSEICLLRTHAA